MELTMNDKNAYDVHRAASENFCNSSPTAQELFVFIDRNFVKLKNQNFIVFLPVLHHSLKNDMENGATMDIGVHISKLLQQHGNEDDLKMILQILYQTLKTLEAHTVTRNLYIGDEVFFRLTNMLERNSQNKSSNTNILTCLQLYVRKFKSNALIQKLWTIIQKAKKKTELNIALILLYFFDEFKLVIKNFHRDTHLIIMIQQLLDSEIREERKNAHYIIKKVIEAELEIDNTITMKRRWTVYVTTIENLEENQSHLILPSLESLRCIDGNYDDASIWKTWMNILYKQILSHNNILVIRWALNYFFERFVCDDIDPQVLHQVLVASNNTSLYNAEGYCLSKDNVSKFINYKNASRFLGVFANVHWKSVPLHFWLLLLNDKPQKQASVCTDLLMKIAGRVRMLQNTLIRKDAIKLVENIFASEIEFMRLDDYVMFIETLYNVMDSYNNIKVFARKMEEFIRLGGTIDVSQRFYAILTNNLSLNDENKTILNTQCEALISITKCLEDIPKEKHSWLRFMMVFYSMGSKVIREFCHTKYDIDVNELVKHSTLRGLEKELIQKLVWDKAEESIVCEKSVDIFACRSLINFSDMDNMYLLDMGSHEALLNLSEVLASYSQAVPNLVLESFSKGLKKCLKINFLCYKVVKNLLTYVKNTQSKEEAELIAEDMLSIDLEHLGICRAVLESRLLLNKNKYARGFLIGDSNTGDARIEEIYELSLTDSISNQLMIRNLYAKHVPEEYIQAISIDLLELNDNISRKKPRYFENCKEHRLKIRIASVMLRNIGESGSYWGDELWQVLLTQNNQLNVTYIYELLTAKYIPNSNAILERLKEVTKYTASQQVSIISVTHSYCILNWPRLKTNQLDAIINSLLPLTMGANFQTRLYSQLTIYSILNESIKSSYQMTNGDSFKVAIEAAVGSQITELMEDVRLQLPFYYVAAPAHFFNTIMYITNAPFDEYDTLNLWNKSKYEKSKLVFGKRTSAFVKHSKAHCSTVEVSNVQRKMNPTYDLLPQSELISYPQLNENEMFVVASLVDKMPNLGGIARTCEVLGIKNLVLDSISHIEKSEFKNLSMTAEKSLNILEIKRSGLTDFLLQKQMEGFKIVGAEQTANSISFVHFQFPKKCILMLGHEKEGIPPNLLGLLDYAVEIPQFGVLRSLNVHITGALFMWEYCKQHISEE